MITEPNATLRDSDPDVGLFTVLREDGSADPATDPKRADRRAALRVSPHASAAAARRADDRAPAPGSRRLLRRVHRAGGGADRDRASSRSKDDWVFPALREQSVMLVRGFPLREFIAQVFGNSGDVAKGRQMPSHQSGKSVQSGELVVVHRPAGPAGGRRGVGDEAPEGTRTSRSASAATARRASPTSTPRCTSRRRSRPRRSSSARTTTGRSACRPRARRRRARIAVKGRAYGMPSVRVDGNDLLAVYKVLSDARRARAARRRAHVRRGAHVPDRRALDERRPDALPHRRRGRGVEEEGPGRPPRASTCELLGAIDDASREEARRRAGRRDRRRGHARSRRWRRRRASRSSTTSTRAMPAHLREEREALLPVPPAPTHG